MQQEHSQFFTDGSAAFGRCSKVHRKDASTAELASDTDPSSTPGSHATTALGGIGFGSVAHPFVDAAPASSS